MAVVFIAIGSRGDAQPVAVLAGELVRRGIHAKVVALAEYTGLIKQLGAEPVAVSGTVLQATGPIGTRWGRTAIRFRAGQGLVLRNWLTQIADAAAEAIDAAVDPGDTVISTILTHGVAAGLAAERSSRAATILYTAQLPTVHRDSHYMPDLFGRWDAYNRIGTRLNWMIATNLGRPILRRLQASSGRGRRTVARHGPHPTIIAASPLLVPPAADWPQGTHQTGYLAMPRVPMLPPSELVDFLASGPKPIYVGFGSLSGVSRRHGGDVELLADAARIAHRRIVTTAGPGQPVGLVDDRVLLTETIPHNWLLPRMAGMVHHGGAGSTHEGLRAGVPSMGVPFGVDQPYHAERLHSLGVGPRPLPIDSLTPRSLARALRELTSGRFDERASLVAVQARAEDGVGATIKVLAQLGLIPQAALEGSGS